MQHLVNRLFRCCRLRVTHCQDINHSIASCHGSHSGCVQCSLSRNSCPRSTGNKR
ncbi:hypothetical protein BC831DRAFT_450877 [Entophlyctis helioformis]|nr:hypothetical protein BC831DRAFT_450877 [Entophlyctis helioformis]